MDLTPSKRRVAWLDEAEDMLLAIFSDAQDLISRAAAMPAGDERNELLRKWALLSDGANHLALTAVDIVEKMARDARALLEEEQPVE